MEGGRARARPARKRSLPERLLDTKLRRQQWRLGIKHRHTRMTARVRRLRQRHVNAANGAQDLRVQQQPQPLGAGQYRLRAPRERYSGGGTRAQLNNVDTSSVIYAIYHVTPRAHQRLAVYVGRTSDTALERYKQHLRNARVIQRHEAGRKVNATTLTQARSCLLAQAIAHSDWRKWRVVVLAVVPPVPPAWRAHYIQELRNRHIARHQRAPSARSRNAYVTSRWTAPYENFWQDVLQSHTRGYNVVLHDVGRLTPQRTATQRVRRRMRSLRHGNPLMRRGGVVPAGYVNPAPVLRRLGDPQGAAPNHAAAVARQRRRDRAVASLGKWLRGLRMPAKPAPGPARVTWMRRRYRYRNVRRTALPTLIEVLRQLRVAGPPPNTNPSPAQLRRVTTDVQRAMHTALYKRLGTQHHCARERMATTPMFIYEFPSAIVDNIPFEAILGDPACRRALPKQIRRHAVTTPVVGHHYPQPLARMACNYSQAAAETTLVALQAHQTAEQNGAACYCHHPRLNPYRDAATGHVTTHNLNIVDDPALRHLLGKGAKFRMTKEAVTRQELHALLTIANDTFCKRWAKLANITEDAFDDWKDAVINAATPHIDNLTAVRSPDPANPANDIMDEGSPIPHATRRALEALQQNFIITTVDKNPHAFSIVCKRHYLCTLNTELAGAPGPVNPQAGQAPPPATAYQIAADTEAQAVQHHAHFLAGKRLLPMRTRHSADQGGGAQQQREQAAAKLPTAFMSTKFHKQPINHRFMAAVAQTASTRLSQNINVALKGLLPELARLAGASMATLPHRLYPGNSRIQQLRRAGLAQMIHRSWIVTSSDQVRDMLDALNRDATQLYSRNETRVPPPGRPGRAMLRNDQRRTRRIFHKCARWATLDFSTLYTAIPHNDNTHGLKQRMAALLTRIFNQHERREHWLIISRAGRSSQARWKKGYQRVQGGVWHPPAVGKHEVAVGAVELIQWINFLVDHCYVSFAGQLFRQVVGLPMGEACSGMLANCYLFTYELAFIENLMDTRQYGRVERYLYTVRYIDDIGSFNNPHFVHERYLRPGGGGGIYPRQFLTLNVERAPSRAGGRLLDLFITTDPVHARYVCNTISEGQDVRPRPRIRFPDIDTLLSTRSRYGIVLSESTRYQRGSMQWRAYTLLCGDMMYDMHRRGYSMDVVYRKMRQATAIAAARYGFPRGNATYIAACQRLHQRIHGIGI